MAGKEGKDTNTIPIPVGLADNLIRASSLREGQLYLESLKTYYYSISRLGVQVTDLSARENELQAKFASLSHYVQDKVTSLQSELNAAVIRLRPLTKSCLIEEAAQARARILIVWNGQYRKFANVQVEHDYHPEKGTLPTFGVINQPLYAAGIIKQKDTWGKTTWTNKNGTGSHRPGTGSRNTQPFNTWEEAVHYYLNYYRTCWFRMNDAIMLNRNNWTQTTRQVEWEENHEKYISPKTNSYHDVYDLFLETWEPKEGIEQTWYTEAMLEAEIDRRVSAEHLDYTTTLASYIHFTPIYKQMSWEKYHTKLIEQNFANAVPVATAEMAVQKKKIEDELDQLKEIAAAKLAYDAFVQQLTTELRDVMRILAVHPVEEDSGQQEVIYRNVQQSSTDRNAQITNQFSNQPTMQAVIRIPSLGYIVCQNCGSHEQTDSTHCTACGKAIDPIVVLNVQRSTQGISMNERNQRITTIKQYNLAQKYLRKRADVEAEIVARQQMPQPPPQQPQAPKQKPATPAASPPAPPVQQQPPVAAPVAAPQPVPTPRKRVVPSPVAGQEKQCKQCGTQNNQTANFCQNCGAKL